MGGNSSSGWDSIAFYSYCKGPFLSQSLLYPRRFMHAGAGLRRPQLLLTQPYPTLYYNGEWGMGRPTILRLWGFIKALE
jgi:hypothetical protein